MEATMNRYLKTQLTKLTWTQHGWQRVKVSSDEIERWQRTKVKSPVEASYGNPRSITPELRLLQEANDEILFGDARSKTDELPPSLKFLLSDPDKWFINKSNTALFAVVDPITQVYEYNEWGSDRSNADPETINDRPSASRLYVEALGIIPRDSTSERLTDILGSIGEESHSIKESPFATRVPIELGAISDDNSILGEEDNLDDIESAFKPIDDEIIVREDTRTIVSPLPEVDENTKSTIRAISKTFNELMAKATSQSETTALTLSYEQALDREIGTHITTCINSPYCGHGYTTPRRRHEGILLPQVFNTEAAAEERVNFFYQLLGEASSCDSETDLFGKWKTDPITGERSRTGGFLGKIRGMYNSDKELWAKWSINDHVDRKTGEVINRSALSIKREEFIRDWREKRKGDEEQLRIAVWVQFDRRKKTIEKEVFKKGRTTTQTKQVKDSIWLQKRAQAFTEAFLTKKQWDSIYKMTGIIKQRLKLNRQSSEERRQTLDLLAKHFTRIDNIYDLNSYIAWAKHRKWVTKQTPDGFIKHRDGSLFKNSKGNIIPKFKSVETFDFYPSLIDRISILDESRWTKSCIKLRRHLLGREVLYQQLRDQVQSIKETNVEVSIPCTNTKCLSPEEAQKTKKNPNEFKPVVPAQAIGKLKWYEIKEDKGLLGLECEQCGQIVWQLGHKETPILKTFEEATNEY